MLGAVDDQDLCQDNKGIGRAYTGVAGARTIPRTQSSVVRGEIVFWPKLREGKGDQRRTGCKQSFPAEAKGGIGLTSLPASSQLALQPPYGSGSTSGPLRRYS